MFNKETELVALHFSDTSLIALRLDTKGSKYSISAVSSVALKPGVIEDGRILSLPDLTVAVTQLFAAAKPQALKPKEVVICLPESKVFSVVVSLPSSISASETVDSLRRKVSEVIPVDEQLLVADYQKRQIGEQVEYFYAATYQTVLDDFTKLFDGLQIKIRLATTESLALAKVLGPAEAKQTAVLLDIGARTTIASIVTNQYIRETVTIANAGDVWTKVVMEEQKISWEEAEKKKQSIGVVSSPDNTVAPLLLPYLQRWSAEIKLFISYWQQGHSETIATVILTGGSAQLPGLAEYLQSALGLPTILGQPPAEMSLGSMSFFSSAPVLGLALMAADEQYDDINFVSPKLKNLKRPVTKPTVVVKAPSVVSTPVMIKARSNRRPIILLTMLIVALAVFGFVWWRSVSPTSSFGQLIALSDNVVDGQTMNITFVVAVNNSTSTPSISQPVIQGTAENKTLSLSAKRPTDAERQRVKDGITVIDAVPTTPAEAYQALLDGEVNALWQGGISDLTATYVATGRTVIPYYVSSEISTSTPSLSRFIAADGQTISLAVNFRFLAIERPIFLTLIQGLWQEKYQQELPSDYQLQHVKISTLTPGLYQVNITVVTSPK